MDGSCIPAAVSLSDQALLFIGLHEVRHTAAPSAFTNRGRSRPWSGRRSDTIEAEGLAWNTKHPANALVVVTPRFHHCRVVFSMFITRRVLRPRSCRIGARPRAAPTPVCESPWGRRCAGRVRALGAAVCPSAERRETASCWFINAHSAAGWIARECCTRTTRDLKCLTGPRACTWQLSGNRKPGDSPYNP